MSSRDGSPVSRAPRRAVTGRALVLGTVIVLLLVLLASPLNRYFESRGALSSSAQQVQRDQQRLAELRGQIKLWGDPGYIQEQARRRLQYAMPGDSVYVVAGAGQRNEIAKTAASSDSGAGASWNAALWGSVQHADDASS